MLDHGISQFDNVQQAREALFDVGFIPLCKIGNAEHFVRDNRRCILYYETELAGAKLAGAKYVWFTAQGPTF